MRIRCLHAVLVLRLLFVTAIAIVPCGCRDRAKSAHEMPESCNSEQNRESCRLDSRQLEADSCKIKEQISRNDELMHEVSHINENLALPGYS